MGEMKPTKGEAFNKRDGFSTVYVEVRIGGGWLQEVAACGPTANGQNEQQANADLITEAFNVLHNTGLSPVQLVEQRDELVAVVKALIAYDESDHEDGVQMMLDYADMLKGAYAALAKCVGVK